jgi:hypothetical protein
MHVEKNVCESLLELEVPRSLQLIKLGQRRQRMYLASTAAAEDVVQGNKGQATIERVG